MVEQEFLLKEAKRKSGNILISIKKYILYIIILVCLLILIFLLNSIYKEKVNLEEKSLLNISTVSQYQYIIQRIASTNFCDYECLKNLIQHLILSEIDNDNFDPLRDDKFQNDGIPYRKIKDVSQCDDTPINMRFDCSFDNINVSPSACEARGCCWREVQSEDLPKDYVVKNNKLYKPSYKEIESLKDNETFTLSVPYCYYPQDYSLYRFKNINYTKNGIDATLKNNFKSGFPNDISELKFEAIFETCSRIRIKIKDKYRKRWETPIPVVPKDFSGCSGTKLYSIDINEQTGDFVIRRSNNGVPIFDTRNAAPLIYADQLLQLSTLLPSSYVYGLGQHLNGLLLDIYWKRRVLWNFDQPPTPQGNLYGSHPFYMNLVPSGEAYGFFLLNSNAMDVRMQPTPALTFRVIGGILDFYLFLGPSPDHVISQYTDVIGKPFLPPYWSLGYHQCRFGYKTIDQTRKIWKRTRDAGIPFDVQWNDIDYMNNRNDFTYDKNKYSGLPQFVHELHKSGMHYIVITDPGISGGEKPGTYEPYDLGIKKDIFVKNSTGEVFIGKVWNNISTVFPDFTKPNAILYWSYLIQKFHSEVPFDGLWIDMNEPSNFVDGQKNGCPHSPWDNPPYLPPVIGRKLAHNTLCMSAQHFVGLHYNVHNLYGISEVISTYGSLRMIKDIYSPFIISRSTFPGSGSFGGHWTGDISSDWFQMWKSIGDVLTMNILGVPTVGADICGFNGNTTAALCNRWLQLGAFYPFSRNHNTLSANDQDPVALGEVVVRSARKALLQRYTLLPYLYSLHFRSHIYGIPVAKPLFFKYPSDSETYDLDTQFLWGEGLMIIPVLEKGAKSVIAYIPSGTWYDWYSGKVVSRSGKEYMSLDAPLDTIPLLIAGGSILPCQTPGNTTTESRKNDYFLIVALDENQQSNGELFWDDQVAKDPYENKKYIHLKMRTISNQLTIQPVIYLNSNKKLILDRVKVLGIKSKVLYVTINGETVLDFSYSAVDEILEVKNLRENFLKPINLKWSF